MYSWTLEGGFLGQETVCWRQVADEISQVEILASALLKSLAAFLAAVFSLENGGSETISAWAGLSGHMGSSFTGSGITSMLGRAVLIARTRLVSRLTTHRLSGLKGVNTLAGSLPHSEARLTDGIKSLSPPKAAELTLPSFLRARQLRRRYRISSSPTRSSAGNAHPVSQVHHSRQRFGGGSTTLSISVSMSGPQSLAKVTSPSDT